MQEGYDGLPRDKTRPSRIPPLGSNITERVRPAPPTNIRAKAKSLREYETNILARSPASATRVNHVNWSAARGGPSVLALSDQPMISTAHRQEFGLLRNRPDASLHLRARWIAQTRRRLGTANDRRNHHDLRDPEAHRRHKQVR